MPADRIRAPAGAVRLAGRRGAGHHHPQLVTEIDGEDTHFLHVRSPREDAVPLILTHGSHEATDPLVSDIRKFFGALR